MINIKIVALEAVIKWLVGGRAFKTITNMVATLMDEDLTNDEKRQAVKDVVLPMVTAVGKMLLSTIIAYAVDKAKMELADA